MSLKGGRRVGCLGAPFVKDFEEFLRGVVGFNADHREGAVVLDTLCWVFIIEGVALST
jgi:hypothetical protein